MEQLGAGSGAERVQALTESALELLEVHGIGPSTPGRLVEFLG